MVFLPLLAAGFLLCAPLHRSIWQIGQVIGFEQVLAMRRNLA